MSHMAAVNLIQALAALYVLAVSLIALNRMSATTSHAIRVAHITMSGGAVAALASSMGAGSMFECAFAVGVAIYLAADRRKRKVLHGR